MQPDNNAVPDPAAGAGVDGTSIADIESLHGFDAIVLFLLAAFAIDRLVTAVISLLAFVPAWRKRFPEPSTLSDLVERAAAERRSRLIYYLFAGILAIGAIAGFGQIRLVERILGVYVNPVVDILVTGVAMVAGADRIAAILKAHGASAQEPPSRPIEVTGRLVLDRQLAADHDPSEES